MAIKMYNMSLQQGSLVDAINALYLQVKAVELNEDEMSISRPNVLQKLLEAVQLLSCTQKSAMEDLLELNLERKERRLQALKALTTLVRNDYSFSDYGMGPTFYNLSLLQAPFTSEVIVSKQMIREVAIEPLF